MTAADSSPSASAPALGDVPLSSTSPELEGSETSPAVGAAQVTAAGDLGATQGLHNSSYVDDWPDHWYRAPRGVAVPSLQDRLERYLRLRGHVLSTAGLPRDEALDDQAAYVMGAAVELVDAVADFIAHPEDVTKLLAVQAEIADVVLSATTLRWLMSQHGLPAPEVEICIERKTQFDRGRDDRIDDGVTRCRMCGCTDDDCSQCIAKTGNPCAWVETYVAGQPNICTACALPA